RKLDLQGCLASKTSNNNVNYNTSITCRLDKPLIMMLDYVLNNKMATITNSMTDGKNLNQSFGHIVNNFGSFANDVDAPVHPKYTRLSKTNEIHLMHFAMNLATARNFYVNGGSSFVVGHKQVKYCALMQHKIMSNCIEISLGSPHVCDVLFSCSKGLMKTVETARATFYGDGSFTTRGVGGYGTTSCCGVLIHPFDYSQTGQEGTCGRYKDTQYFSKTQIALNKVNYLIFQKQFEFKSSKQNSLNHFQIKFKNLTFQTCFKTNSGGPFFL
ncbi:hypothetical protein ACJX0J_019379, partial [Zea mays]